MRKKVDEFNLVHCGFSLSEIKKGNNKDINAYLTIYYAGKESEKRKMKEQQIRAAQKKMR